MVNSVVLGLSVPKGIDRPARTLRGNTELNLTRRLFWHYPTEDIY
jgi:hypothetical protein